MGAARNAPPLLTLVSPAPQTSPALESKFGDFADSTQGGNHSPSFVLFGSITGHHTHFCHFSPFLSENLKLLLHRVYKN